MKKKILAVCLASTIMYSCNKDLESRKQDLEDKLSEINETIMENPEGYNDLIDRMLTDAYKLKLETAKEIPVKKDHIDPRDFTYALNKTGQGVYISIHNKKTKEDLSLIYVENTTQLGDINHRFYGLKQESVKVIYEKTKGVGKKLDSLSEKWTEIWFLLGNMF